MLKTLKKWGADLLLEVKDFFTLSGSDVYIKDFRQIMIHNKKKCRYPKNYDQIVEFGEIIENKYCSKKPIEKQNLIYQLKYNKCKFDLVFIKEVDCKYYFTIDFLVSKDRYEIDDYREFYEPFRFKKKDLEKYLPVFEIQKKDNKFALTNSSSICNKTQELNKNEMIDWKEKNGQLLYTSDYKRLGAILSEKNQNGQLFEIRDPNGNLELDKSLISIPIAFVAGLAKICVKLLIFIPVKMGRYLMNKQNSIVKFFGYFLFTSAITVKNLVNIGTTVLKAPLLLFVADKKKYADTYWTIWKYQLKEYWKEAKKDYLFMRKSNRLELELEEKDYPEFEIAGTWKELNARRQGINKNLESEILNKGSENTDKSKKLKKDFKKLYNTIHKQRDDKSQIKKDSCTDNRIMISQKKKQNSRLDEKTFSR
ncbi:MAG: hypothetical protein LKM44_02795 [Wolbachia endosymbiont of Meromenopon meropis]|nr:hypothetical protein [Wolbachia endosymbiont of Meromenopon meropis]